LFQPHKLPSFRSIWNHVIKFVISARYDGFMSPVRQQLDWNRRKFVSWNCKNTRSHGWIVTIPASCSGFPEFLHNINCSDIFNSHLGFPRSQFWVDYSHRVILKWLCAQRALRGTTKAVIPCHWLVII
jgi:hypothetical protein